MVTDLPDYHQYVSPSPSVDVFIEYPSISQPATPIMNLVQMTTGISEKSPVDLTTDYLKKAIILPNKLAVADPTGAIPPYENGWVARALIYKAGTGEVDLAGELLDAMVDLQLDDGSFCQQYYPVKGKDGKCPCYAKAGEPYQDIQVDSGAGLLVWAMADHDIATAASPPRYLDPVKKALDWLRTCQVEHHTQYPESNLLANQRWDYVAGDPKWNYPAFTCDSAECLLAMKRAMDAYGSDLTTSSGYSVQQMANDIYASLVNLCWLGDPPPDGLDEWYFRTEYPPGADMWLMPAGIVPQGISYAQGMTAMAIYVFANSGYLLPGYDDFSQVCERALNWTIAITQGKWGGFYYHPASTAYGMGISGDGVGLYDEFPAFTAIMVMAMDEVNSTLYADRITRARNFIKLASISGGRVYNRVKIDGRIDLGEGAKSGDGMHFRSLNSALGLLAGA